MREIITVSGSVTADELGFCQCHEHLMLSKGASCELNPALLIEDESKSLIELNMFKAAGGSAVIDAQPCGCNRMAAGLGTISAASGIHVIAATGFHKLCFYPENHWIHSTPISELTHIYVAELTVGMYLDADYRYPSRQCRHRAGIIKTALDSEGLTSRYIALFTAAAKAALITDSTIMIHVEPDTDPMPLLDLLIAQGIAPYRLIFCHMDRACKDLDTHYRLLSKGAYVEFDTIGRFKYHSDAHEIKIFQSLIDAGYEEQILFSLDTTRERLKAYNPKGIGLDYILTTFIPQMKAAGITSRQIELFSIHNPVCVLTQ